MRINCRVLLSLVILAVLVMPCRASAALGGTRPWWEVVQSVTPTDVSVANERGEVQALTLSTEGEGTAFELKVGGLDTFFATSESLAKEKGMTMLSAASLQKALEGAYGKGDVTVTMASSAPSGHEVMLVEGGKADLTVTMAPIVVKAFVGVGSASVSVVSGPVPAGEVIIRASDIGDGSIEGERVRVRVADVLPSGLTATGISGTVHGWYDSGIEFLNGPHGQVTCTLASLSCEYAEDAVAFSFLEVKIPVVVTGVVPASPANEVTVAGGGGAPVARSQDVMVTDAAAPAPFGVEAGSFEMRPEGEGGVPDALASSHPFQFTTAFTFANTGEGGAGQAAQPRNLRFLLPAGLVGNAQAIPRCSIAEFDKEVPTCPSDTVVGVAVEAFSTEVGRGLQGFEEIPVFNLDPGSHEPALFAFSVVGTPVYLTTSVRSGVDYGVVTEVENVPQVVAFSTSVVTLWGSPSSPLHNGERGYACLRGEPSCELNAKLPQKAFLTIPGFCQTPFAGVMEANAWTQPEYLEPIDSTFSEPLDGCDQIPFSPSVEVAPDTQSASSASGLTVDVRLPQGISEDPEASAEGTIRNTSLALPPGVQLNPSDAGGLQACSEAQIGYLNKTGENGELEFTGNLPEGWEEGEGGFCPEAAKIGTVTIRTPLLKEPLKGAIYLATPYENPFHENGHPNGSLLAMYIVAEDSEAGITVKLPGDVRLCGGVGEVVDGMTCGAQGQLISTFEDTPQLPFEDLELHFFGGERAPLSTPAQCGSYATQAVFEPWSGGSYPASSTFEITSGRDGSSCPGALPFNPSLTAGTTSNNAANFSPFTMTMSREDGNQNLQAISLKTPPGLSGILSGVELCAEAQANAGTCGQGSLVGETIVSVGLGDDPYTVTGGKVYLTGPYEGAPFGLSIVNPANAGPFHLGNVIVRAKIEVNPITAELTVTSDNSGPYKIPQYIDGIPLQIKHVNVTINRPGFTFNPTSCEPMHVTGTLSSAEGASQALSVPFQVANCANLAFKPIFKASTSGHTSRADGASLNVKLAYPKAPLGTQANIRYVKVELPRQLPSEARTLQQACLHETFEANPASCPSGSRVGSVRATTPILPVALEGPAYFVSYGGARFPELIMVLQGYGVTVDLHAETFINEKTDVTSSTLRTVPDVPVGTFELNLPERPFSALGASANLCRAGKTIIVTKKVRRKVDGKTRLVTVKRKKKLPALSMPTEFIAQSGVVLKQSTPISVTGCSKPRKAKKAGQGKHHGRADKAGK